MDGQDRPVVVAQGRVYPITLQTLLHNLRLLAGMAKVEVHTVLKRFIDLKVDNLPESECATLALCKGSFITWRKEMITLAPIGIVHLF